MNNINRTNYIKISKSLVIDYATSKSSYNFIDFETTSSSKLEFKDYSKCKKSCPFYNLRNTHNHCQNDCVFVLSKSTYNYKANRCNLSESQFKQLLYYHSMVFENNGVTINLTLKDVATAINVDTKTVANNIKALEAAGYIVVNKYDNNTHIAFILNYQKYHQKDNKGGYFYLSKKCFEELVKLDDVNAFRLALLLLVKIDNLKGINKFIKKISYKFLINILPSYINTKKQINTILNKLTNIIELVLDRTTDDEICYREKQTINNTFNNNKIEEENISLVNKYLEKKALVLKSNQTIDLYQMSCQYGFNIVKNAIELCYDNLVKLLEVEKINIGGYIRSVIKNEFRALISKL